MIIKRLYEVNWTESYQKQFEEIFYTSSSRQNFASQEAKRDFLKEWTEYYFKFCPDEFLLAIDPEKNRLMGYLTGCSNSEAASIYHNVRLPDQLFGEFYSKYPAHLHINCLAEYRGLGIGKKLIDSYCSELIQDGVKGLHIVTSPGVRNVNFYRKNGFTFECIKKWQSRELLFMGRPLIPKSKYHHAPSLEPQQI